MFGHKKVVEELRDSIRSLKSSLSSAEGNVQYYKDLREKDLKNHEFEIKKLKEMHSLEIEKAKIEVKEGMRKDLIESDLKRVEAVAKLNTYIDMDTKDDRKHISKMLEKAIDGLSKQSVQVVK